jgi:hypothetical protein
MALETKKRRVFVSLGLCGDIIFKKHMPKKLVGGFPLSIG